MVMGVNHIALICRPFQSVLRMKIEKNLGSGSSYSTKVPFVFVETSFHLAQADFELIVWLRRMASNF